MDRLREAGFVGREWDGFAYQRARYAMDRLPWLIRSGEIWKKGRDRNLLGFANRYPGVGDDLAEEMSNEVITLALNRLRDLLRADRWDPAKGAAVDSYFFAQCLMQFPNVYHRLARPARLVTISLEEMSSSEEEDHRHDPTWVAGIQDLVARALEAMPSDNHRVAIVMRVAGYSVSEIAERLGVSARTVHRLLEWRSVADRTLEGGQEDA